MDMLRGMALDVSLRLACLSFGREALPERRHRATIQIGVSLTIQIPGLAMFKYQCGSCDKWHEGPPCLAFVVPDIVQTIPSADVARRVTGDENICVVDGTHFFIRASLRMPIIGEEGEFDWSLWVSVSEASFMDYYDTYEAGGAHGPYFSWLGNQLPAYPTSEGLRQRAPDSGSRTLGPSNLPARSRGHAARARHRDFHAA